MTEECSGNNTLWQWFEAGCRICSK